MYKYHGMLLGFAAYEHHVGFYAISTAIQQAHAAELKGYKTGKGSIQFPLGTRLPINLVRRMVAERVAENERKASAEAKAKAGRKR